MTYFREKAMESDRLVPRNARPRIMRQIVITERSVPEHIKTWLVNRACDAALVVPTEVGPAVRQCLALVRGYEIPVRIPDGDIEQELLAHPA
jgi:hypothetical protein